MDHTRDLSHTKHRGLKGKGTQDKQVLIRRKSGDIWNPSLGRASRGHRNSEEVKNRDIESWKRMVGAGRYQDPKQILKCVILLVANSLSSHAF